MRILALIEIAAILAGIIGVIAGWFFGLPKGVDLGIFLAGAGIALGGLESIFTRRMGFRSSADQYESYAGAPAMIVGLMALLIGAVLIGSAYLLSEGMWHSMLFHLARRPGLALIGAGMPVMGAGVLMMLNPRGRRGVWWTLLVRVPRWILGLVVVLAGFASVGLGIWECFEPQAFDRFVAGLPRHLDWREFARWWKNRLGTVIK